MPPQNISPAQALAPAALPSEPTFASSNDYHPPPGDAAISDLHSQVFQMPPYDPVAQAPVTDIESSQVTDADAEVVAESQTPQRRTDAIAAHAGEYHRPQAGTLRLMQRSLSSTAPPVTSAGEAYDEPAPLAPAVSGETTATASQNAAVEPAEVPVGVDRPAAPPGSNSLAISGLILAFVFAPLGLIISIMALAKRKSKAAKVLSTLGIGISLIGIVAMLSFATTLAASFSRMQGHNADMKHQANMEAVENQLQAAFIKNGTYPTLAQLNSSSWRATNLIGTTPAQLSPANPPTLLLDYKPTTSSYAYVTTPADCNASATAPCTSFSLSAALSNGQTYTIN